MSLSRCWRANAFRLSNPSTLFRFIHPWLVRERVNQWDIDEGYGRVIQMVGIDPLSLLRFNMIMKSIAPLMILTALLLGLPMLGATSTGHPISLYLEFPPHTRY